MIPEGSVFQNLESDGVPTWPRVKRTICESPNPLTVKAVMVVARACGIALHQEMLQMLARGLFAALVIVGSANRWRRICRPSCGHGGNSRIDHP